MTLQASRCQGEDRRQVALRMAELNQARATLQAARSEPTDRWRTEQLRIELVSALEHYAAAVAAVGEPLAYRLRDELRLYRSLGGLGGR